MPYSCLPNDGMIPLIRKDFGDFLIKELGRDIQFINARIRTLEAASDDYFILNVTSKVVGIDPERSDFNLVPGTQQIMSFKRLSYVEGCLGEHMLARDAEYLSHLLVSAELVEILNGYKLSCVEFQRPEEVKW